MAGMCRSIKTLRTEAVVTADDTRAAALQYVRKISGYRKPSKANEAVFETAVDEITAATDRLLTDLAPWVPIFNRSSTWFVSARVRNCQESPYYAGPLLDQMWVR